MAEYKEEQLEYCRNCLKQHKCKDWRNIIHGCPEYEPHILVGTLTKEERDIVDYLEKCYVGAITALPAADVRENVRAHWYDVGSLSCRCSACGCKSNRETAFCPNCGAQMGGEEDG